VTTPPRELLECLRRYDSAAASLALRLRPIVHDETAPCHEYIFEMRSKVVLPYGATERVIDDGICNIGVFNRHVTLGFPQGTELEDAARVLAGTGRMMRHVKVRTMARSGTGEIRAYLRQARKHAGVKPRRRGTADES
jgi:hypothetical protein